MISTPPREIHIIAEQQIDLRVEKMEPDYQLLEDILAEESDDADYKKSAFKLMTLAGYLTREYRLEQVYPVLLSKLNQCSTCQEDLDFIEYVLDNADDSVEKAMCWITRKRLGLTELKDVSIVNKSIKLLKKYNFVLAENKEQKVPLSKAC